MGFFPWLMRSWRNLGSRRSAIRRIPTVPISMPTPLWLMSSALGLSWTSWKRASQRARTESRQGPCLRAGHGRQGLPAPVETAGEDTRIRLGIVRQRASIAGIDLVEPFEIRLTTRGGREVLSRAGHVLFCLPMVHVPPACGLGSVIWRMTVGNFARLATRASDMASTGAVFVMVIKGPGFLTSGSALPGAAGHRLSSPGRPAPRHDPSGPARRPGTLPSPARRSPGPPSRRSAAQENRARQETSSRDSRRRASRLLPQSPAGFGSPVMAAAPAGSVIPFEVGCRRGRSRRQLVALLRARVTSQVARYSATRRTRQGGRARCHPVRLHTGRARQRRR